VPLVVAEGVSLTLTRAARRDMKVSANWDGPIAAPIKAGQEVGTLTIEAPNAPTRQFPIYAGANVDQIGLFGRAMSSVLQMVTGE